MRENQRRRFRLGAAVIEANACAKVTVAAACEMLRGTLSDPPGRQARLPSPPKLNSQNYPSKLLNRVFLSELRTVAVFGGTGIDPSSEGVVDRPLRLSVGRGCTARAM